MGMRAWPEDICSSNYVSHKMTTKASTLAYQKKKFALDLKTEKDSNARLRLTLHNMDNFVTSMKVSDAAMTNGNTDSNIRLLLDMLSAKNAEIATKDERLLYLGGLVDDRERTCDDYARRLRLATENQTNTVEQEIPFVWNPKLVLVANNTPSTAKKSNTVSGDEERKDDEDIENSDTSSNKIKNEVKSESCRNKVRRQDQTRKKTNTLIEEEEESSDDDDDMENSNMSSKKIENKVKTESRSKKLQTVLKKPKPSPRRHGNRGKNKAQTANDEKSRAAKLKIARLYKENNPKLRALANFTKHYDDQSTKFYTVGIAVLDKIFEDDSTIDVKKKLYSVSVLSKGTSICQTWT